MTSDDASSAGSVAIVTGSAGLVGAEAVRQFAALGLDVVGIDDDHRRLFFGADASTVEERAALERDVKGYRHISADIRDTAAIDRLFSDLGREIAVVIHAAAQPSHDWAAQDPETDFSINATATLGLLEATRRHCPAAPFIFMSTNKVYGDEPNRLPLIETESRFELSSENPYFPHGIDESMSVDRSAHSLFGVSKLSADLMVQEYGRRFGLSTVCFRGGCITGPGHRGAFLHGFMSHLCTSAVRGVPYRIVGYKGKQVRDNLHSKDLAAAFRAFFAGPKRHAVYNIGGGRGAACSVLELLDFCDRELGRATPRDVEPEARYGDHIWWISDNRAFQADYPGWAPTYSVEEIAREIIDRARPG